MDICQRISSILSKSKGLRLEAQNRNTLIRLVHPTVHLSCTHRVHPLSPIVFPLCTPTMRTHSAPIVHTHLAHPSCTHCTPTLHPLCTHPCTDHTPVDFRTTATHGRGEVGSVGENMTQKHDSDISWAEPQHDTIQLTHSTSIHLKPTLTRYSRL